MFTMNINMQNIWKYTKWVLLIISVIGCSILWLKNNELKNIQDSQRDANKTTVTYYDQTIKSLKKQNRSLYDSIKNLKDVESAIQYIYKKEYRLDTVFIKNKDNKNTDRPIIVYKYKNNIKNDTINYELTIGSKEEPDWYKLNVSVGDKFTIINRKNGDLNQTTIQTDTHADIIDVTPIHVKKNKFWNRFNVNANVSAGYGIFNKKPDIYVGIGLGFRLFGK